MDNAEGFQALFHAINGNSKEFMKGLIVLTWLSIVQTILLGLIVWRLW